MKSKAYGLLLSLFVPFLCEGANSGAASAGAAHAAAPFDTTPDEVITGPLADHLSAEDLRALGATSLRMHALAVSSQYTLTFNMETVKEDNVDIDHVVAFLRKRKHIKELKITHMKVDVLEKALTQLVAEKFKFDNLVSLDLSGNPHLTGEVLHLFTQTTPRLHSLNVDNCKIDSGPGHLLATITDMSHLTALSIRFNHLRHSADLIRFMSQLTTLDISFNNIGDEGAYSVSRMKNLTTLNIRGNNIGDEGAELISGMNNLTSLDISQNNIGSAGAGFISRMPHLITLNIDINNIGSAGAASIGQMPHLTTLYVGYSHIGDAGAASISRMKNLTTLSITGNNIGPAGAEFISHMNHLTTLYIGDNKIHGIAFISQMRGLKILGISARDIGDARLDLLKKKLPNTRIHS